MRGVDPERYEGGLIERCKTKREDKGLDKRYINKTNSVERIYRTTKLSVCIWSETATASQVSMLLEMYPVDAYIAGGNKVNTYMQPG